MDWTLLIIVAAVATAFYALKRLSFVSPECARQHLAAGALVIDVRTPQEFAGGHVPGALNIPLGELRTELPRRVPERTRPLLIHCLSGGRSAIAARQARKLAYATAFNLGSYRRAERIVAMK
jgi:phage shock protein E